MNTGGAPAREHVWKPEELVRGYVVDVRAQPPLG